MDSERPAHHGWKDVLNCCIMPCFSVYYILQKVFFRRTLRENEEEQHELGRRGRNTT